MKYVNIVVEGDTEETFVSDVMIPYFAPLNIYLSARKITTGWDKINNKKAKGGIQNFIKFRNEVLNWIESDRGRADTFYTSFVDLYAFPKDKFSPYTPQIQNLTDPYQKIQALEAAIAQEIGDPKFIPYVQLHEFETFILADPNRLIVMYPDGHRGIKGLKADIGDSSPEEVNETFETAPSKRIIKFFPAYEAEKSQVGPMVAEDIGMAKLRAKCPHFDEWLTKLETI